MALVCQHGQWAYAFIKGYTAAGAPLPSASLVALAQLSKTGWQTVLPSDGATYDQALAAVPADLVPAAAQTLLSHAPNHSLVAAFVIEFFTANHTSIPGFYNKNVTFHVEAFAFPRVG